ncbi:MAG: hypothetical protein A2Y24_07260 [Clostridiales bacterium GWE2_32_10]|nr:MAG: hypothetical protein A2Y24_07260 [Clostridiales bacterium GWE2_32_10]HBY20659.1 hypothetical protein [Clostridiales bacterium]
MENTANSTSIHEACIDNDTIFGSEAIVKSGETAKIDLVGDLGVKELSKLVRFLTNPSSVKPENLEI